MEKRKGSCKCLKHQCRSIKELYKRISVNFCYTIEVFLIPLLERLLLRSRLVKTSRPDWISCIHNQKNDTLNKKSQRAKRPWGKLLVNWRSEMLSGCEIIEQSSPRWIPGSITTKFGPWNYQILANGKFHKIRVDQLQSCSLETLEDTTYKYLDFPDEQSDEQENQPAPPVLPRQYPQRENRRPPDRLTYNLEGRKLLCIDYKYHCFLVWPGLHNFCMALDFAVYMCLHFLYTHLCV